MQPIIISNPIGVDWIRQILEENSGVHYNHLLAVEAEDEGLAQAVVESFLQDYENEVWDWYDIGGRWAGELDGVDILCFADNPSAFRQHVNHSVKARDAEFREIRDALIGRQIKPEELPDVSPMGLPYPDKEKSARAISEHNLRDCDEFQELLASDSVPDEITHGMIGYKLHKLGKIVAGYYNVDSMFYDVSAGFASTNFLWKRCEEAPSNQFLVNVDLHS